MFEITTDQSKKIFIVKVGGFFLPEEGAAFLSQYQDKLKNINPKDYNLIVDGTELKTSKVEMLPVLEKCMELYKSTGFKAMFGVRPESPTASMQLEKVCKDTIPSMKFGKTMVSVISMI